MTDRTEFYQQHLNRVSRSFAFCIAELSSPLREWVGLSYILFRILDTVEDALWTDWKEQDRHFAEFHRFLEEKPSSAEVDSWVKSFPSTLPGGELLLLQDAQIFFDDFHSLERDVRNPIQAAVAKMNRGMEHFSHTRKDGILKLTTLIEVNQYCFCVAGLVGGLLCDVYRVYAPRFEEPADFYSDGFRFGLFLQKINLLKDQMTDEPEGRYLIHDRSEVVESLRADAEGALSYIQSLPESEKGFRTFCAWSLFLGLASLPFLEEAYSLKKSIKISREMTQLLLTEVSSCVESNSALQEFFDDAATSLPSAVHAPNHSDSPRDQDQWFIQLAQSSHLGVPLMKELGFLL